MKIEIGLEKVKELLFEQRTLIAHEIMRVMDKDKPDGLTKRPERDTAILVAIRKAEEPKDLCILRKYSDTEE